MDKRYKILPGLPATGPMYIPITHTDNVAATHKEGFVVRFQKIDNTEWVANFEKGFTNYSDVIKLNDIIVVVAGGQGYLINPDEEKAVKTFDGTITNILKAENSRCVVVTSTNIAIIDDSLEIWRSRRISWDEIKNVKVENETVSGLCGDITSKPKEEWVPFTLNIKTKEITGGSYYEHPDVKKEKKWWEFWK